MADPAFGTTRDVDIAFGDVDTRLLPNLLLDSDSNLDPNPQVLHNIVTFDIPETVIVEGQPKYAGKRGAKILTRSGATSATQVLTPLDPQTLNLGANAIRWRPNVSDLDPPANGGRRWWPIGSSRSSGPKQSLFTVIPVGAGGILTGRGTFGADSPYVDVGYTYQGFYGPVKRPAMVYDGAGVSTIDPGSSTFPAVTFGLVAVMHPSTLPYYGLFEANQGGRGEPLVYRYSHGRVDLFQANTKVVSHETHKPAHYPVIMLVAMDAATDTGRLMVIDKTRTSRTFNVASLDFISMAGIIGALGQGTASSPWQKASEMDVLEIDIWPEALSFAQMESYANLLALAYGVVG